MQSINRRVAVIMTLCLSPWVFLSLWLLTLRSNQPEFFKLWSWPLLCFQILNFFVMGSLIALIIRKTQHYFIPVLVGGLLILSLALGCKSAWLGNSLVIFGVLVSRIGFSFCIVLWSYFRARWEGREKNIGLVVGAILLSLTSLDLGLVAFYQVARGVTDRHHFRQSKSLSDIGALDYVVVGDSMVYGQGVKEEETFCKLLEQDLTKRNQLRVHNLGEIATGPDEYLSVLVELPKVKQIIVGYYPNDIGTIPTMGVKSRELVAGIGRTSILMRIIADSIGLLTYQTPDDYLNSVVADYDPKGYLFHQRWNSMLAKFRETAQVAKAKSQEVPIFVMFPLMVDFENYPLLETHSLLVREFQSMGVEVVDLLPVFQDKLRDGRKYRLPKDTHFNQRVHELIGRVISQKVRESN